MSAKINKRAGDTVDASKTKLMKCNDVSLNQCYFEPNFINKYKEVVAEKIDTTFDDGTQFFAQPFPCTVLPNFLNSIEYVKNLKQELTKVELHVKDSDLFQFKQSDDLITSSLPTVKSLINVLYDKCRPWLEKLTGFTLSDEVDMTCSKYEFTDVLLCHDDMLKERRIAFIYYLVSGWGKDDGGTLDLFETENGNASLIKHSIVPTFNSFVFFEVSPNSFHQVSEVLKCKSRLSVNGWFHSKLYETKVMTPPENKILSVPQPLESDDIACWVNPLYLRLKTASQIRREFSESSEIELGDFLLDEKYKLIVNALKCETINWDVVGPRNKRYFQSGNNLPPIVEKCQHILHSEEMCILLSNFTGLQLHPSAEVDSSSDSDEEKSNSSDENHEIADYTSTVRKWSPGYYTLLDDNALHDADKLDAILYFNCDEWHTDYGGFTSYVSNGETEELLKIHPSSNSLALIYSDKETAGFVKYINNRARTGQNDGTFYDIFTTFYEKV